VTIQLYPRPVFEFISSLPNLKNWEQELNYHLFKGKKFSGDNLGFFLSDLLTRHGNTPWTNDKIPDEGINFIHYYSEWVTLYKMATDFNARKRINQFELEAAKLAEHAKNSNYTKSSVYLRVFKSEINGSDRMSLIRNTPDALEQENHTPPTKTAIAALAETFKWATPFNPVEKLAYMAGFERKVRKEVKSTWDKEDSKTYWTADEDDILPFINGDKAMSHQVLFTLAANLVCTANELAKIKHKMQEIKGMDDLLEQSGVREKKNTFEDHDL